MKKLLPNDSAVTLSIAEGTIRQTPDDAYAQAIGKKPEYAGRVRGIGSGKKPVKGTALKYYMPAKHLNNWWWMNINN